MSDRRAAIVRLTEWPTRHKWDEPMFMLEAYSRLANEALADAGMELSEVDGLLVGGVPESRMFGPSAVAECLSVPANFAETVDLGAQWALDSSGSRRPHLTTNIVGCDVDDVRVGMPVEAVFEDVTDAITLIKFRPVP